MDILLIRNKPEIIKKCASDSFSVEGQFESHKTFAHFSMVSYVHNPMNGEATLVNMAKHTDWL